jgi:hypothetical protein
LEIVDTEFLGFEVELKRNADRIREAGSDDLTETYVPLRRWYFAFTVDADAILAGHTSDEAVSLRDRSKTYIGYMMGVSVSFTRPQNRMY